MSDAPRTYSGSLRSGGRRRKVGRSVRAYGGCLTFLVLTFLFVGSIYFFWSTRDNHDANEFVAADQKYAFIVADVLSNRSVIAQSQVWNALPPEWGVEGIQNVLLQESGLPDWVLNNLITGDIYISGDDIDSFSDSVLVARMSRVGDLLEQMHRFSGSIEKDHAGGLDLRHLPEPDVYYAVRGRYLVASFARNALINALTISPENRMAPDVFAKTMQQSGAEHVRGLMAFHADDAWGEVFESISFALRIDANEAHLKCHATLRDMWRERFQKLVGGVQPQPLVMPPPGAMAALSANFGQSLESVWTGLGEAFGWTYFTPEQWATWKRIPDDGQAGLPQLATRVLGPLGPDIRVSLQGIDVNEMVPVPEIVVVAEAEPQAVDLTFAELAAAPPAIAPWRLDETQRRLHLPMFGGPSIEPTAAPFEDGILFSTSRTVADALLGEDGSAASASTRPLGQVGNLFVEVHPLPVVENVIAAGRLFAEIDGLKGYTPETFEEAATNWLDRAQRVESLTALAALQGDTGEINAELSLTCRAGAGRPAAQ